MQEKADLRELWIEIVARAGLEKSPWLESCAPLRIEGDELIVDALNPFSLEHIKNNYLDALNHSATENGMVRGIRLQAGSEGGEKQQKWQARAKEASKPATPMGNLKPDYTFESFVVGKSNRMAHAASLAVAEMPGKAYNPLFIWGGVGLGKTHLMHAICHYALARSGSLKVLYLNAEQFLNEFVKAIADKKTTQFKERYRNVDILLIDDIQFLGGREASQEEFFHTFNTLHDGNKQVVICSDRQPSELKNIEDRLISRFAWGLVTDIQPPDLETRIAILQKKATLKNCAIPEEVIEFLAKHIPSNIRELEGALNRVVMASELAQEDITIEHVSEWLKDTLRMDAKESVSLENIKAAVAESRNISQEDLVGPKRTAELAQARQIAMFLCREMTTASLQQIASAFGKKDHTTVLHALAKVEKQVESDPEIQRIVDNIRNKL